MSSNGLVLPSTMCHTAPLAPVLVMVLGAAVVFQMLKLANCLICVLFKPVPPTLLA